MSTIKFEDEADLQRRICEVLNKHGYHFKKAKSNFFCDIVDDTVNAYIEVKTNGKFAPQQLLYGLAREGVPNARYLMLANEFELRVYKCPDLAKIRSFAFSISPDLSRNPSSVTEMRLVDEAFSILGQHHVIYTYNGAFKIDEKQPCIFLDDSNYEYFQIILQKYRINPAEFVNKFATTWVKKSRLFIKNDNETIFDQETGNEVKAHRQIRNEFDRMLIRSTRIKPENIKEIIHKMDALAPLDVRRKRGKYWSNLLVSDVVAEVVREIVKPTFIFEPFVGGGSLVRDFVGEIPGVVNDIDGNGVALLEDEWDGYGWTFHKKNFLTTPIVDVMENWGLPKETERFLIYTNPPFGTVTTNKLASKQGKDGDILKEGGSRKNVIDYGATGKEEKYFGDTYGRGDLCLPSIAHMIEIIKRRGNGYLAFFSPFGVMLGRSRYNKVLMALLKDFEFLHGEVFGGEMFNGVSKDVSISFTIWEYEKDNHTKHEELVFIDKDREIKARISSLLKDGWDYDTRREIRGEIGVQGNDRFNSPTPKMLKCGILTGGSELIPENVKKPIDIQDIPDELIYGLWSRTVGRGGSAIVNPPRIFSECLVHLPQFDKKETIDILAYSVIYSLITEIKNNYCNGLMGFIGMNRIFKFGGERLTKGAQYLVDTFGGQPVGEKETVKSVFDKLKEGKEPDEIDKNLRIDIRREVEKRLDAIGYWDYLPVPDIGSGGDEDDEKQEKLA